MLRGVRRVTCSRTSRHDAPKSDLLLLLELAPRELAPEPVSCPPV